MAISEYRYAGAILAAAGSIWDVQKQNMGTLELVIDKLVPGAKEVLTLSLQEFEVPGRVVGVGDLHYLNGVVRYPTKPEPQGNITVTFRDFPLAKTRSILERWFKKIYDETTGLMLPPALMKANGFLVLFQSDGTQGRTARLEGLWITKMPSVKVTYSSGEALVMETELACDRVIWESSLASPQ